MLFEINRANRTAKPARNGGRMPDFHPIRFQNTFRHSLKWTPKGPLETRHCEPYKGDAILTLVRRLPRQAESQITFGFQPLSDVNFRDFPITT
jgi:hypothetical protein